jgi:hypothetical protein
MAATDRTPAARPIAGGSAPETGQDEIEDMYQQSLQDLQEGEVVKGTIIGLTANEVLVDVGYKSEGAIPIDEFRGNLPKVGDEIEVYLEAKEDNEGLIVLSKDKADKIKVWDVVTQAFERGALILGDAVPHLGEHEARAHRVHCDAGRLKFSGQSACETHDPVFGGAIGRRIRIPFQPRGRGSEHDSPCSPAFPHDVAQRRLHRQKRASQIDADHPLPMLGRDFRGRRTLRRAGIGDNDIDRSMCRAGGLHHRRAIRGIRHIRGDRGGLR